MVFFDSSNLISVTEAGEVCENGILFSVQNYLHEPTAIKKRAILTALEKMKLDKGLYNQHPEFHKLLPEDYYMSHDDLTAIMCFSYFEELDVHKDIWEEIKMQMGRYNNLYPKNPGWKFIHPRDLIFYGYLNNNWICTILIPILFCIMLLTSLTKYKVRPQLHERIMMYFKREKYEKQKMIATDGILLNYIMLKSCKEHSILWKLNWLLHSYIIKKRFGNWKNVFLVYFKNAEHPCVEECNG